MNQGIVDRWNSVVKPGDEVYVLGDLSLSYQGAEMVKYLNGQVFLIPGNHDKCHQVFHKNKEIKKANAFKRYEDMGIIVCPEYYSLVLSKEEKKPMLDVMEEGKISAQICHFPYKEDHGNFEYTPRYQNLRPKPFILAQVLLHGHVHVAWKVNYFWDETDKRFIPQINMGCDVWDWTPVSEPDLVDFAQNCVDEARVLRKTKVQDEE